MTVSAADARRYLEQIEARTIERRGAIQLVQEDTLNDARLTELNRAIKVSVQKTGERSWQAPSVWHAASWLRNVAHEAATKKLDFRPRGDAVIHRGCLIFRGQQDTEWPLVPSIGRGVDLQTHVTAGVLFSSLMETIALEEMPTVSPDIHLAAAQHYGVIKTWLLDFTTDPRTALFFACDGAKPLDLAAVYLLPVHDAARLGGRFLMAPHWVRRIHRQRGLFLDSRQQSTESLAETCFKLEFPVDESYLSSDLAPTRDQIYPEDPWLQRASEWALEQVLPETVEKRSWQEVLGEPPFKFDVLAPDRLLAWMEFFLDLVQGTALRVTESGDFGLDCEIVRSLKRDNPGLFFAHHQAFRVAKEIDPLSTWPGQLGAAIEECVSDKG